MIDTMAARNSGWEVCISALGWSYHFSWKDCSMALTHRISASALAQALEDARAAGAPRLVVVDCRFDLMAPAWGREAFLQQHLPGALYFSLDDDLSGPHTGRNGRHPLPSMEAFAQRLGQAGIDADTTVVAYDQGALMMAARLWWMLRWLGHDKVQVLDGGMPGWLAAGLPTESGAAQPTAARSYVAQPRNDMLVTAEQVQAALGQGQQRLIDARAPERYRGEVEPLDRVPGHIPGARNRPFTANLEQGLLVPVARLRAEFAPLLEGASPAQVVHTCGSGVSAAANVLAMEEAGLTGSRLYAGSWSEWSSDPERPVETGNAP